MGTYAATIEIPELPAASPAAKLGRNLIINPRFQHWQKGDAMPAPAAIGGYQCDFWGHRGKGSKVYVERRKFPIGAAPLGLKNQRDYMRCEFTSVPGAYNYSLIAVDIDGCDNFAGSRCSFPLAIRADRNQNIALEHNQHFGLGGASPEWTGEPQTLNVTTDWQLFRITIDDWPSVTGKTLGSSETDTDRIGLVLILEAGSNLNARTNNLGQKSGWVEIARGEVREDPEGSLLTMDDPWSAYDAEAELLRCQSLLEVFSYRETIWSGYVENTKPRWLGVPFKVTKRRMPVVTVNKVAHVGFNGAVQVGDVSLQGVQLFATGTQTINTGYFQADVIVDANHPYTP